GRHCPRCIWAQALPGSVDGLCSASWNDDHRSLQVQPLVDAAEGEFSGGRRVAGGILALRDQGALVEADDLHREVHTDDVGVERHRWYQVYGVSLNSVCPAVRHEDLLVFLVPDTCVVGFDLLLGRELRKISEAGYTPTTRHTDDHVM